MRKLASKQQSDEQNKCLRTMVLSQGVEDKMDRQSLKWRNTTLN